MKPPRPLEFKMTLLAFAPFAAITIMLIYGGIRYDRRPEEPTE